MATRRVTRFGPVANVRRSGFAFRFGFGCLRLQAVAWTRQAYGVGFSADQDGDRGASAPRNITPHKTNYISVQAIRVLAWHFKPVS